MSGEVPRNLDKWQAAFDRGLSSWDWNHWESILWSSTVIAVWAFLWVYMVVLVISPRTVRKYSGGFPVTRANLLPGCLIVTWIVGIWANAVLFLGGPIAYLLYSSLEDRVFFQMQEFATRYLDILGLMFGG